jgi:hypothetical protein
LPENDRQYVKSAWRSSIYELREGYPRRVRRMCCGRVYKWDWELGNLLADGRYFIMIRLPEQGVDGNRDLDTDGEDEDKDDEEEQDSRRNLSGEGVGNMDTV